MTDKEKALFEKIPTPPEGSVFSIKEVRTISLPHPYMITEKHVVYAADHCGGMLGESAISQAEKLGKARCGMRGCNLRYDQHENNVSLVVIVPQNKDLNDVPGLHTYLLALKEADLGIQGFAFSTPAQAN